MSLDGGSETLGEYVERVALLTGELLACGHILAGDVERHLLGQQGQIVGNDNGFESASSISLLFVGQASDQKHHSIKIYHKTLHQDKKSRLVFQYIITNGWTSLITREHTESYQ